MPIAIAVATFEGLPESDANGRLLVEALRRRGADAAVAVWTSPCDWRRYDGVVIQTCWDYHLRAGEFLAWAEALHESGTAVVNSPSLLRWNHHKAYLLSMRARGVDILPMALLRRGEASGDLEDRFHTADLIAKPAISASAMRTFRFDARLAEDREKVETLCRDGDVIVQPFEPRIAEGETSFVFFGGEYSHAVLKRARPGEFRVQSEYGGSSERITPPTGAIRAAERALAAAPEVPVYARVDGLVAGDELLLMELELIEPELFLTLAQGSADRFAAGVCQSVVRR